MGLTTQEIDALGRHLPVLRVIAGEWTVGPTTVLDRSDRLSERLTQLQAWRDRITCRYTSYYGIELKRLLGYIDREMFRVEDELTRPRLQPATPVASRVAMKTKRDERSREALELYVNKDMTLDQIAEVFMVTRERVRQLITIYDPTLYLLAVRRRHARNHLRKFVQDGKPDNGWCIICGTTFRRVGQRRMLCSPEHRRVWEMFRYHLNPESWEKQRTILARRILETGVGSIQGAKNVLNGEVNVRGRWLQEDSKTFEWALLAYQEKWPMFDNLPLAIQQQIVNYTENGPRPVKITTPRDQLPRNVMRRRLLAGEEISGATIAKEIGTVPGVFINLKHDMVAEGYQFVGRREGKRIWWHLEGIEAP